MNRVRVCFAVLFVWAATSVSLAQRNRPTSQAKQPAPEAKAEAKKKAGVDPAAWVPANAIFYLGITDVDETWAAFQKTNAYAMLKDAEAADAITNFDLVGPVLEDLQTRLAKSLDLPREQLRNPFDGPLALYVTAPPNAKLEDVEVGIVAGASDMAVLRPYYDTLVGKLKELAKHQAVPAGSDSIDVFTPEAPKEAPGQADDDFAEEEQGGFVPPVGPPAQMAKHVLDKLFSGQVLPRRLALCLTSDRLIVAGTPEHVRALLQAEKLPQSLADSAAHKSLLKHLKPTGTVRLVVNMPRVVELAQAAAKGTEGEELRKWLEVTGAESLEGLVGHCRFGASSYDSKVELLFLMDKERKGLAKLLSMENMPVTPPPTIPSSTCIYVGANVSAPRLLDDIEDLVRQSDPNAADQMRAAMEMPAPDGGTVNLRKDVLEYLRGPLTVAFGLRPTPPDRYDVVLELALGHSDEKAVTRALGNPAITQVPLTPRDAKGVQVFDLPPLPPMMMGGLAAAATKDRLLLGLTSSVEADLAGSADRLSDTERWKQAARLVPEQAWLVTYVDSHALMASLLAASKSKSAPPGGPDLGTLILMGMVQGVAQSVKDGDLAGAERLLRYSGQQVYTISTTPEGVQLTAVEFKAEK